MLYQILYTALALSVLVAGFFAGRKIHHLRGTTLLWVVLLIGIACMSPELVNILAPKLAAVTGFSQWICLKLIAFATVFGGGIFFALTLPPPGTFSARNRA
ncbi:MAG: hypothetical protein C0469_15025 [Cyanobacteria bacterium DS2.3.42]|nr:hypothetical protein [Cyanobacteria bacterium DS2.3.42]